MGSSDNVRTTRVRGECCSLRRNINSSLSGASTLAATRLPLQRDRKTLVSSSGSQSARGKSKVGCRIGVSPAACSAALYTFPLVGSPLPLLPSLPLLLLLVLVPRGTLGKVCTILRACQALAKCV